MTLQELTVTETRWQVVLLFPHLLILEMKWNYSLHIIHCLQIICLSFDSSHAQGKSNRHKPLRTILRTKWVNWYSVLNTFLVSKKSNVNIKSERNASIPFLKLSLSLYHRFTHNSKIQAENLYFICALSLNGNILYHYLLQDMNTDIIRTQNIIIISRNSYRCPFIAIVLPPSP